MADWAAVSPTPPSPTPPSPVPATPARVILLTGATRPQRLRVARWGGVPVVGLDDFFKDLDDPTLPRVDGVAHWTSPSAWYPADALFALVRLSYDRSAELPDYDAVACRRTGTRRVELGDATAYVAEGSLAGELAGACRDYGILADALRLGRTGEAAPAEGEVTARPCNPLAAVRAIRAARAGPRP